VGFPARLQRHLRLSKQAKNNEHPPTPPFLILFINSICNLRCDHCFYWDSLNKNTDLTKEELFALADSLGTVENLNLSGGEPFMRPEFGEICAYFVRKNGVKQIYCPTNGYFTDRTEQQLAELFREPDLDLFAAELSLDGMPEFHNEFRGNKNSFERAMETYDMLAEFQEKEPRLQIHSIATATGENIEEIKELTTFLYERCPKMSHHNIAMIRGERKRPTLEGPGLQQYRELVDYASRLWADREEGRFGSIVDPMLHWGKIKIAKAQEQAIPCRAGLLSAVVHANGDVAFCEEHPPLGNLRDKSFPEIWNSPEAVDLRKRIWAKDCFCTNEVFLWPSIVFQPKALASAMIGAKVWKRPAPLLPEEKVDVSMLDKNGMRPQTTAAVATPTPAK
jgi:MoaA/NifB/PqqE/SkfB family radical SAM enzyme